MATNKLASLVAGIVFAVIAGISLYRLLFWFPITIGEQRIGQVATFFALVISAALCLILVRGGIVRDRG
jgi:hypothetical protein